MEVFVGTIMPVAFNFAPRDWLPCEGQILQIQQYNVLYSVIGAVYGGDGDTTFALPDLRGRIPVGTSLQTTPPATVLNLKQGATTGNASINNTTIQGVASIAIDQTALPAHTHQVAIAGNAFQPSSTLHVSSAVGGSTPGSNTVLSSGGSSGFGQAFIYASGATPELTLDPDTVTTTLADVSVTSDSTGSPAAPVTIAGAVNWNASVSVMQPSLGLTFIICVNGNYPVRP